MSKPEYVDQTAAVDVDIPTFKRDHPRIIQHGPALDEILKCLKRESETASTHQRISPHHTKNVGSAINEDSEMDKLIKELERTKIRHGIDLEDKQAEINRLRAENEELRETGMELHNLLGRASASRLSLDSGVYSDAISRVSFGSLSSVVSDNSPDVHGASVQRRNKSLLQRGKKILTPRKSKTDTVFTVTDIEGRPVKVACPHMTLSEQRVNWRLAVSGDKLELIGTDRSGYHHTGQFENYWGTCSSPIPLTTSPSNLKRYWEGHTRVWMTKRVEWRLWWWYPLLELGVSIRGEMDTEIWVVKQRRYSWSVTVGYCYKHRGYICTRVYREGRQVGECYNTLTTPGIFTFRHGVVLDKERGRLAFLDVVAGRVLHKFDVKFSESLYPMFSVDPSCPDCGVTMRLISGSEISMSDSKKRLIARALFS